MDCKFCGTEMELYKGIGGSKIYSCPNCGRISWTATNKSFFARRKAVGLRLAAWSFLFRGISAVEEEWQIGIWALTAIVGSLIVIAILISYMMMVCL